MSFMQEREKNNVYSISSLTKIPLNDGYAFNSATEACGTGYFGLLPNSVHMVARLHIYRCQSCPVADPELANGGAKVEREYRGAEGADEVWGVGRGFPPTHWGRGLGRGSAPSPENFFDFRSKNVDF